MQQVMEILYFIFTSMKKNYITGNIETQKRAAQESDIPSRIIKENSDIFGDYLLSSFNDAIDKSYFPTALKQSNTSPVFRTGERYLKDTDPKYIAKCVKKVLKNMFRQMSHYINNFLSKRQKRFQKRIQQTILPFKNA